MSEHIVETSIGKVRGVENGFGIDFLGIPYAAPPVGERRFKRSILHERWEGVFEADHWGSAPVQYNEGQVIGSEDCLTLNIRRPLSGEKLPVYVWIYGGGYNTGYSSDTMYQGESFVKDGIIYASFNYRTNVLGFYDFTTYPGCEDFESNCGLSDQILALNWIHDNIAAFGGDPERITIGGESAGGASIVNMLACPGVKGCFSQAIVESGLPNCMMTHQMSRQNMDLFLEGMHWTEKDLPKLRTMDPKLFLLGNEYVAMKHQYKNPGMFLPGPVIDDLLPVRPIEAIRAGSAEGVKVIIGTNQHEGTMFVHPENTGFPNSWSMVARMFERNGNAQGLWKVMEYYHRESPLALLDEKQKGEDPFIRFATDYAFEMPAVKVAMALLEHGEKVWMYRYELVTKSGIETGWKATHAAELPAVFKIADHPFAHFIFDGEEEAFEKIAGQMHGEWLRFMKEGNPADDWAPFEGPVSPVRIYDRETKTVRLDRSQLMEAWGDLRFYEGDEVTDI